MKNKIIYGSTGTGKTVNYFKPEIQNWKGKTIAISNHNEGINDFKKFELGVLNLSYEEILVYDKILLTKNPKVDSYFCNKDLLGVIKYLIENISYFKEPVLVAIDEFAQFNLTEKFSNNESIILNLLKSNEINTLFLVQSLKQIREVYKSDYEKIMELSELFCTKVYEDYSGELRVRFPKSLHKYLKEKAEKEGVSLNQYIVYELTKAMK
ncbi:MAG: hypothetical protein K0R54_640 [Clostridiaceae bacterium]|jgi:predicted HicB family RNase H-like nuclease|nr:hypothetical protein [Clostridiaceae bacterium]